MTKEIVPHIPPQAQAMDFNLSLGALSHNNVSISESMSDVCDINTSLAIINSRTQPGNFAFGLGVAFNKAATALEQKFASVRFLKGIASSAMDLFSAVNSATSFPGAQAAVVEKKTKDATEAKRKPAAQKQKSDKIDTLITKLQAENRISMPLDESTKPSFFKTDKKSLALKEKINSDLQKTVDSFLKQVRMAAQEGEETRELIEQCLAGIDKIEILHPKWSKDIINNKWKDYAAAYHSRMNIIVIIASNNAQIGSIIHECWHVKENLDKKWKAGEYDIAKIDVCQKNLKSLLVETIDCFNGIESERCDEIKDMAKDYKNRPLVLSCSQIEANKEGFITRFELESVGKNTKDDMVLYKEGEGRNCGLVPYSLQSLKTNERIFVTDSQAQQINMMMNLDQIRSKETIKEIYKEHFNEEYHANTIERVPEKVLKKTCPDGFRKAEEERKSSKSLRQEL